MSYYSNVFSIYFLVMLIKFFKKSNWHFDSDFTEFIDTITENWQIFNSFMSPFLLYWLNKGMVLYFFYQNLGNTDYVFAY